MKYKLFNLITTFKVTTCLRIRETQTSVTR